MLIRILMLLVVTVLGCRPGIVAPEFQLRSVSAMSSQETVIDLAIYNPNRFPLHVQSVDYEVSVGEKLCARGRREEPLFLDARDSTDAEFNLSLDWNAVAEAFSLPADRQRGSGREGKLRGFHGVRSATVRVRRPQNRVGERRGPVFHREPVRSVVPGVSFCLLRTG